MFCLGFVTLSVLVAATSAKFPNDPKPCEFGDSTCIQSMVNFLLEQKFGGYSALNLIQIDPLKIAAIDIIQGGDSSVNIDLRFRKSELLGLQNARIVGVKGFGQDMTQQHEIHMKCPLLSLVGDYKLTGKVLVLPVQGSGLSNITFLNTDVKMLFSGTPEEKADGTYLKIKKLRMTIEPKKVFFNLTRLFNGDQSLSKGLSTFVNDNWETIYREVKRSIENAFSQVFKSVINNVFEKYPYEKFFAQVPSEE